jgi:hypothetical protein
VVSLLEDLACCSVLVNGWLDGMTSIADMTD